jgi:hypothetical protein
MFSHAELRGSSPPRPWLNLDGELAGESPAA